MGKSTVAAMIRELGIPIFDADAEVRRLQGPGGALLPAIEALFPGTTHAGGLDREKLGQAVFGDRAALERLEHVIHPAVERSRRAFVRRYRARRVVVLDIPLLFEKGGWRRVDAIVVVSAAAWQQRKRVLARPGMTAAKLARIRALQTPDAEKRRRADFILSTGGTQERTGRDLRRILACVGARAGR
ncbi:dephospho-CoA kinase [Sphingomonas sp. AP4-R1]|uniref:dephospho-CoA kinase n=1 Tax=Sphingomonas sp. AP4-R1 TaxID=2735134 RepID=UPI001493CEF3|nr:dephospho-CoA kinase [Sphingomonas sp. AP4-R1]QJU60464.1 dephospho-CoA kinase [Sphingomonas sp. AP4-R1]